MTTAPAPRPAQVLVLAKAPVPGRVKTRLTPPYLPEQAAALAGAALRDSLRAVAGADVHRRVLVLDGDPGEWVPDGFDLRAQRDGDLDLRLEHALLEAWADAPVPVLLVGMDTPQITSTEIEQAVDTLLHPDVGAVLGPACDGGFWAIGVREPVAGLVVGVPMSRGDTCAHQHDRLVAAGLRVRLLATHRDVDVASDAAAVAAGAPGTQFAAAMQTFGVRPARVAGAA